MVQDYYKNATSQLDTQTLRYHSWHLDGNLYLLLQFDKRGGILFFLNCNYGAGKLDRKMPLLSRTPWLLSRLRSNYEDPLKRKFMLWNNRDINAENKSAYCKAWRDKNVLFMQDLLNNQDNYLSPQEFSVNITSKPTFCNNKSPQLFPLISKVTH